LTQDNYTHLCHVCVLYGKNFAEVSKNLVRYRDRTFKLIELTSRIKTFCSISSTFKRSNYFDGPTKLFSNLYLAKFLRILTKSFFTCIEDVDFVNN